MGVPEDDPRQPDPREGRRRASGIYGTIVTAAVIAAGGGQLSTLALEITVLVTLLVYWLAEQYAELLGEHTHGGRLPSVAQATASLRATWPMVSASFIPLLALLVARLAGATTSGAAEVGIVVSVVLLIFHAGAAARAAAVGGFRLVVVTGMAGLLGVVMIVLKALLQHQHH